MASTSAGRRGTTVIRTYAAAERASAEASFLRERDEAERRGWQAISQRWRSEGREQVLTVVFETRGAEASAPPPDALTASEAYGGAEAGAPTRAEAGALTRAEADQWPEAVTRTVPWDAEAARAREAGRTVVETLDLHAAGQPLRLVRSGFPAVPHLPIEERRAWATEHADHIRRRLMLEPRGHRDMHGAVLLAPWRDDADVAVLFMHGSGYGSMCGHDIIALTHGLIEEGLYPATTPRTAIRWETPAGLVVATAEVRVGSAGEPLVRAVRFLNVPAYLHADRVAIRPRGIRLAGAAAQRRSLSVQIAYGGAYYGIVDAADLGVRVVPERIGELTEAGAAITEELRREHTPSHPLDASLGSVYGTIIVDSDPSTSPDGRARDATIRNVTVFADAEVDRSPCGSGTSAILAARYALGASDVGDELVNAGLTGETFLARVEGVTRLGDRDAILTSVQGRGFVTGRHTFTRDARDPLADGFLLR